MRFNPNNKNPESWSRLVKDADNGTLKTLWSGW